MANIFTPQIIADLDQSLIQIAQFSVTDYETLLTETAVTLQALDQYAVIGQIKDGAEHTLYDEATDFTAPDSNGLILMAYKFVTSTGAADVDNDLTTTAALSSALLLLNVKAYDTIIIKAACAANNGSVTTKGSAQ